MGRKWGLVQNAGAWLNARRKAIAGLVVFAAAFVTANGWLDIDPEFAAAIAAILGGAAVERTSNK